MRGARQDTHTDTSERNDMLSALTKRISSPRFAPVARVCVLAARVPAGVCRLGCDASSDCPQCAPDSAVVAAHCEE